MSDQSKAAEVKDTELKWVSPEEGVFEAYSNNVFLNWTITDIRIRFGQVVPSDDKQGWEVSEYAAITLPWVHAKYLRDLLSGVIEAYEKVNGEIKLPIMPFPPAPPNTFPDVK